VRTELRLIAQTVAKRPSWPSPISKAHLRLRLMLRSLLLSRSLHLALFISALWLIASGHAILDDADPGFVGSNSSSSSSVEHGKHRPLDYACSLDPTARRINRRLGPEPNDDGSSPPLVSNSPVFLTAERPSLLFPASAPLGLAECWRFHWRTALDPRAPSSVS